MDHEFEFLNSSVWLKYSQQSYRTPDEIRHRLTPSERTEAEWLRLKEQTIKNRRIAAVPLFLTSIQKKFWFFPADCILRKAHEIEKIGQSLYDQINKQSVFASEFFLDATVEEAITSAIYEGANSTRAKAKELIEAQTPAKTKDEWMLLNNYRTLLWTQKNHAHDITVDLLNTIHAMVTQNTLAGDDANYSGRLRDDQVFVHSGHEVKHEGVAHDLLNVTLPEAVHVVTKSPRYFPALLKGILLHYFVSYIHPYFDGNGRTARAIFYYNSIRNDLKFVELLSVSAYLKDHGKQYERSFEKVVQNDLDLTYFIDFNLDALLEALKKVKIKIDYLLAIQSLRQPLDLSAQQTGLLQKLALMSFRKYDIESYAQSIDRSREIARQELKQLAQLGLLDESKEGKKLMYRLNKGELAIRLSS